VLHFKSKLKNNKKEREGSMGKVLEETKFLMKKYKINANKSLGQNFLINDEVIENIINSANITSEDLIIEIGPGLGSLTAKLLERAGKVIAIELDNRMVGILNDRFKNYKNLKIISDDILKIDLQKIIDEEKKENKNIKVVANLPYYITTPIIMKLLEDKLSIDTITVMIQKEVADRITAIPGEKCSGAITYSVYYYAETSNVRFVSKDCFIPSPEVDSEVISLKIRKDPVVTVNNEEVFFRIIKASFMQRRKTLINALINGGIIKNKEDGKKILKELDISEKIRGEELSIEKFAQMSNLLS